MVSNCSAISIVLLIFTGISVATDCGSPGIPSNGLVDSASRLEPGIHFPPGTSVSYSCAEPNYVLRDPNPTSRQCQESGKWTGYRPWCDSNVVIDKPITISNQSPTKRSIHPTQSHDCFTLPSGTGSQFEIDLEGQFAVHSITLHLPGGRIEGQMFIDQHRCHTSNETDHSITFECMSQNHGVNTSSVRGRYIRFLNTGHQVTICNVEAFSNPVSFECGSPEIPADGSVEIKRTNEFVLAKYACNGGYQLIGETRRICHGRHWQGQQPVCKPVPESSDPGLQSDYKVHLILAFSVAAVTSLAMSLGILGCLLHRPMKRTAMSNQPKYSHLPEAESG